MTPFVVGQLCKIPDKLIYEFETPSHGGRCLQFSADGQRLATGCPQQTGSTSTSVILIHSIGKGSYLNDVLGIH